jgi:hypothetical protein
MKSILLLLPLLASAAVIGISINSYVIETLTKNADRRQFGTFALQSLKPAAIKKMKAQYDDNAVREVQLYGPFKMQPANVSTSFK